MKDGAEQRRLVFEAVVKGPLRDARALRDRFDARRAVAAGEKEIRRGVENAIGELRRFVARRAAAETPKRRGRLSMGQRDRLAFGRRRHVRCVRVARAGESTQRWL